VVQLAGTDGNVTKAYTIIHMTTMPSEMKRTQAQAMLIYSDTVASTFTRKPGHNSIAGKDAKEVKFTRE